MKATDENKIKKMVGQLEEMATQLELITGSERNALKAMDSRKRALGNRETKIESDIQCMDIARVQINCAIEDLCKTIY